MTARKYYPPYGRCACTLVRVLVDGVPMCPERCPPRRGSRRNSVGVKPGRDVYLSAEEARAGEKRAGTHVGRVPWSFSAKGAAALRKARKGTT